MRSPDYYLKELLYEYDCVTIPGFGGFITQSQPSRIDRPKNRIHPPVKSPSFNSLLNHDDGLLISHTAKAGNISYHEAGKLVHEFSNNLKMKISRGENITLDGIGELKKNTEGAVHFIPAKQVNFLADAFGLETLNLYPVSKPPKPARPLTKPVDRTARQFRDKKTSPVKWTLALSIPVILFLLYGIIFPSSIQTIYTNYSGIVYDIIHPEKTNPPADVKVPEIVSLPAKEPAPEIKPEPEVIASPVIKPESITETALPASSKYYIIGGCFEKEENALKFLDNLLTKGFEAEKAGTTKRGHLRISYKSFVQKEPALSYLQKIREEENASAWLLKW